MLNIQQQSDADNKLGMFFCDEQPKLMIHQADAWNNRDYLHVVKSGYVTT